MIRLLALVCILLIVLASRAPGHPTTSGASASPRSGATTTVIGTSGDPSPSASGPSLPEQRPMTAWPQASSTAARSGLDHTAAPATTPAVATPGPTSTPRSSLVAPARFIAGQATWWYSLGPGWYVAVRPDLGIAVGSSIEVCDAHAQHCRSAPVVTTCACLGPGSGRVVDLSRDLFAQYADPSLGVTQVVLEVTP